MSHFQQQSWYISAIPGHQLVQFHTKVPCSKCRWDITVLKRVCLSDAGSRSITDCGSAAVGRMWLTATTCHRRLEDLSHDVHTADNTVIQQLSHAAHLPHTSHTWVSLLSNLLAISFKSSHCTISALAQHRDTGNTSGQSRFQLCGRSTWKAGGSDNNWHVAECEVRV